MPTAPQPSKRAASAFLTAAVSFLLATSFLAALLAGINYAQRLNRVRDLLDTQRVLARTFSAIQDAETGQRGFLLTGRPDYLRPYERARAALPGLLATVQERLGRDRQQEEDLSALRLQIDSKLRELEGTTRLTRSGHRPAALQIVASDQGRRAMEAIRTTLDHLDGRAASLQADEERAAKRIGWMLLALMAVTSLAIPFLLVRASRDVRRLFKSTRLRLDERRTQAEQLGREIASRDVALSGAEDRFSLILDAATDYAIIITDPDGMITRWSRGAEQVFGWPAALAEGRPAHFVFTPEDVRDGVPAQEMRAARDEGRASDERWHLREDGSPFWASGELQPLRTKAGELIGYLKIVRDRTEERLAREAELNRAEMLAARVDSQAAELESAHSEREEHAQARAAAEDQVRQLQKLEGLGQLTAGIAHDFNNMLAVVIGALDLLKRKFGNDDPGAQRLLAAAEDGASRAAELTKRLLAFSRQQALEPQVLDLNRQVSGMSELLRRAIGEQVQIETVLAGGLWPVNADPHEVERALVNLAVNARDAMPEGGKLTVETSNAHLDDDYAAANAEVVPGQYVAIAVTDTGTGMSPDVVARAFDPFYSTKGVGQGTGLGLSQVFGFAKQSAGHVKIYSEPGHGTTVKLYLPRWYGTEKPVAPKGAGTSAAPLPRGDVHEIVLVVEDEERVRMISVETLRELGYTVRHAANGEEALRVLDQQPGVTLLFTDIVMPGMTGRELVDLAVQKEPDLKALFTTGYTRNAVVHGGVLDAGVAFLPKPFTVEQLARKVRATIDGHGANRQAGNS